MTSAVVRCDEWRVSVVVMLLFLFISESHLLLQHGSSKDFEPQLVDEVTTDVSGTPECGIHL